MSTQESKEADPIVIFGAKKRRSLSFDLRGIQVASSAICLLRHKDTLGNIRFVRGVGVLYPDIKHLYFAEINSRDPQVFWRSMYATTLTSVLHLSDVSVKLATLISDTSIPLTDPRFALMQYCISYGDTVESFRQKVIEKTIPDGDLKAITEGFKFFNAGLDNHATATLEKGDDDAYGFFCEIISGVHPALLMK